MNKMNRANVQVFQKQKAVSTGLIAKVSKRLRPHSGAVAVAIAALSVFPSAQADPFDWKIKITAQPTVPCYRCAPNTYTFNLKATIEGALKPASIAGHFTLPTTPAWTWTGVTTQNGDEATLTKTYVAGATTDTVTATATFNCVANGGACPDADFLTKTGTLSVTMNIGLDTPLDRSREITASGGYAPTVPNTDLGITYPETVEINVKACLKDGRWHAIMTGVDGRWSQQVRILPHQIEAGTNLNGNNYCDQVSGLLAAHDDIANPGDATYFMQAAVEAHENVHALHYGSDLSQAALNVGVEAEIEAISVADAGFTEADAIALIKADASFNRAKGELLTEWRAFAGSVNELVDHNGGAGRAYQIMQPILKQKARDICNNKQAAWPPCAKCPVP